MGYVQDNLRGGERVVHQTGAHWSVLVPSLLFLGLGTAVCAVIAILAQEVGCFMVPFVFVLFIGLVALADAFSKVASTSFAITDRRVMGAGGVLQRYQFDWPLGLIQSISVERGFVGRFLDAGTITLSGQKGSYRFGPVGKPVEFKAIVEQERVAWLTVQPVLPATEPARHPDAKWLGPVRPPDERFRSGPKES